MNKTVIIIGGVVVAAGVTILIVKGMKKKPVETAKPKETVSDKEMANFLINYNKAGEGREEMIADVNKMNSKELQDAYNYMKIFDSGKETPKEYDYLSQKFPKSF